MRLHRLLTCLPIALLLALPPARAVDASTAVAPPVEDTGTLAAAPYRIDIPADWNGELVMLVHGFEPVGVPRASPWPANEATPVFLSKGYAVAQSGFATQGWAMRDGIDDTERLRAHFVERHGAPRRTWLVGFSMGGGIAVASLEQQPAQYDGVLSLCGANVPGARLAEELFTTLVAFDAFFPGATGVPDGGLSGPAAAELGQMDVMNAVTGALPGNPDAAALLAKHMEVPVDAVPGIVSLHALVFNDMRRRAGGLPVDNTRTVYTGFGENAVFNAAVPRHAGDAAAMAYAATAPALTGQVRKPLVIQYNTGDPTIAPRLQPLYAALAHAGGDVIAPLVLPDAGEGHCGFSPEQIGEAFRTLTQWSVTGKRPGGE